VFKQPFSCWRKEDLVENILLIFFVQLSKGRHVPITRVSIFLRYKMYVTHVSFSSDVRRVYLEHVSFFFIGN
jgi:hypothetical protein